MSGGDISKAHAVFKTESDVRLRNIFGVSDGTSETVFSTVSSME
jgi:hypothetical protein